ncbi:hypothetical protein FBQ81_06775 [Chloroflexi bacterium CFX6]|nr:hypothetical protein [Chloroflexi bacterium CFX6]
MPTYEISNPLSSNLSLRTGPNVIYGRIASLAPGLKGKGDFIMTYQSPLVVEGTQRAQAGDQWMHVTELNGAPVDGWMAIKHLGRVYLAYAQSTDTDLTVSFGVDLEGYQPIILTGILKSK